MKTNETAKLRFGSVANTVQWNERIAWPLVLIVATLAAIAPWLGGAVEADLRPALKWLLGGGVLLLVLTRLRATAPQAADAAILLTTTLLLGAAWWAIGGMAVPSFSLLLVMPVIGAILASNGWLEYAIAAAAVVVAGLVALLTSGALRWYLSESAQFGWAAYFGDIGTDASTAIVAAARADMTVLAHLALTAFGVALIGRGIALALRAARHELEQVFLTQARSQALDSHAFGHRNLPVALVKPQSGTLVEANALFDEMFAQPAEVGATVVDALQPVYPEPVQSLLAAGDGGKLDAALCRIGGRQRFVDIEVRPLMFEREQLLQVSCKETASAVLLAAALDGANLALAMFGPDRELLFASAAFRELFAPHGRDVTAATMLDRKFGLPDAWWDIAPSRRAEIRFADGERNYCLSVRLVGADPTHGLTLIELLTEGQS